MAEGLFLLGHSTKRCNPWQGVSDLLRTGDGLLLEPSDPVARERSGGGDSGDGIDRLLVQSKYDRQVGLCVLEQVTVDAYELLLQQANSCDSVGVELERVRSLVHSLRRTASMVASQALKSTR